MKRRMMRSAGSLFDVLESSWESHAAERRVAAARVAVFVAGLFAIAWSWVDNRAENPE